jgi:sulfide dehydrogenase [flavocytochrome c] flavoprotein subunit
VHDEALAIDPGRREVRLARGDRLQDDRLIVSLGVNFQYDRVPGMANTKAQVLRAWKARPQTVALRRQLEGLPNGGVYALDIPVVPYHGPPGPYKRAAQVAFYFKNHKFRSKVLDANPDTMSKIPCLPKPKPSCTRV